MAAADAIAASDNSVITGDDGAKLWACKSKPLYLWIKDQNLVAPLFIYCSTITPFQNAT